MIRALYILVKVFEIKWETQNFIKGKLISLN